MAVEQAQISPEQQFPRERNTIPHHTEDIASFEIPEKFDHIPTGDDLLHSVNDVLKKDNSDRALYLLKKTAEKFTGAKNVIMILSNFGLGDALIQLPHAAGLANRHPDKKVIILLPPPVAAMKSLDFPSNVKIVSTFDEIMNSKCETNQTIAIRTLKGNKTNIIPRLPGENRTMDSKIHDFVEIIKSTYGWVIPLEERVKEISSGRLQYDNVAYHLIQKYNLNNFSYFDLSLLLTLKFVGANVQAHDILRPFISSRELMNLRQKYLPRKPLFGKGEDFTYDLLVIPDAGEYSELDPETGYTRSYKSIPAGTFDATFDILQQNISPNMRIGVLIGTKNTEYSNDVARKLGNHFSHVQTVSSKTLDDMEGIISVSKNILAKDSLPKWLADAVFRTKMYYQKMNGKELYPRQELLILHNGCMIPYSEYGIRAHGDNVHTLAMMPDVAEDVAKSYEDLNFTPQELAGFIQKYIHV